MKNIYTLFVATFIFSACSSNTEKKADSDSTKTYNQVGVQNATGGIPDTTNAIGLTHQLDTIGNKKIDTAK